MQINEKIQKLNKKLPHGSKNKIAEMTGLDIRTVIKFFKLKSVKLENSQKIITASKDILKNINDELSL